MNPVYGVESNVPNVPIGSRINYCKHNIFIAQMKRLKISSLGLKRIWYIALILKRCNFRVIEPAKPRA